MYLVKLQNGCWMLAWRETGEYLGYGSWDMLDALLPLDY